MVIKEDSVTRRYIFKLIASFISLLCNMVIMFLVPRNLGPAEFGNYNFLYNFFNQVITFLESGSSIALYTRLSQHNYVRTYLTFYFVIIGILVICIASFVIITNSLGLSSVVWPHQVIGYVWLGLLVALLIWLNQLFLKIADSHAWTVQASYIQIIYRFSMAVMIVILYYFSELNLLNYFLFQVVTAIFFSFLLVYLFIRKKLFTWKVFSIYGVQWKLKLLDFWHYCSPLYIYGFAGLISALSNSWLLQKFSGSVQQGYYGLGLSIAAACFLFTSSVTAIFTREYAIAHKNKNLKEKQRLFKLYIPMFYLVTSFFSVFICINASWVILVIGGEEYKSALVAVMVMSLYPVHQTYGQLVGSAYYASENTRGYRNVGVFTLGLSIILAYLFLAPHDCYGLHLGALGSALQMIIVQFVGVNILTFFHTRRLALGFIWFLLHQISVLCSLIVLAFLAHYFVTYGLSLHQPLQELFISAIIYFIIFMFAIWICPNGFGLTREFINTALDRGKIYAKRF